MRHLILSKIPLGENIGSKSVVFPIKTSNYNVYSGIMTEPFEVGATYTLTMKATKGADKTFRAYIDATAPLAYLSPVEGLVDVWSRTFTVSTLGNNPSQVRYLSIT